MTNKTVKINLQTFTRLMRYFSLEEHTDELYTENPRVSLGGIFMINEKSHMRHMLSVYPDHAQYHE